MEIKTVIIPFDQHKFCIRKFPCDPLCIIDRDHFIRTSVDDPGSVRIIPGSFIRIDLPHRADIIAREFQILPCCDDIRNMFRASVAGKEQIILEKDSKIAEVKKLKEQLEADLREKLASAITEKDAAVAQAEAAAKAAAQAIKDAQAAKEQAETANSLAAEKDRTISTLADKLSDAEFKLDGYGALLEKNSVSEEQIKELHRTISDLKKDHAVEIRELTAKLEKQLTDAEKDTALSVAKAVADKERELTALLREAEKEIARLQARIEVMEAHN